VRTMQSTWQSCSTTFQLTELRQSGETFRRVPISKGDISLKKLRATEVLDSTGCAGKSNSSSSG
jgi:hypothetical protein